MTDAERHFREGLKSRGEILEVDEDAVPEQVSTTVTHLLINKKDGTQELKRLRMK